MYKYFKELDSPRNYELYLLKGVFCTEKTHYISNVSYPADFFEKYNNIFEMINFIHALIVATNSFSSYEDVVKDSYENWLALGSFLSDKDEWFPFTIELKEKINLSAYDLGQLIKDYLKFCPTLAILYPDYKEKIFNIEKTFNEVYSELSALQSIVFPKSQEPGVTYKFPDAWYITPNNYLYNTGTGHKEGNLIYPFYHVIKPQLQTGKNIPKISYYEEIKEILERGYITRAEFQHYAHMIYELPTILTPEVMHDIERRKSLYALSEEEYEKIPLKEHPHPERSYQRNLIKLLVGYYAAKTAFYQSFCKLNDSKNKEKIIEEIARMHMDDIFVKFSGFHKVSSVEEKTITTAAVQSIEKFSEYLNRGWNLDIIPGLIYDKYQDKLVEMDFNWEYIDRYFNKILNEYEGKGQIRIRYDDHMRISK